VIYSADIVTHGAYVGEGRLTGCCHNLSGAPYIPWLSVCLSKNCTPEGHHVCQQCTGRRAAIRVERGSEGRPSPARTRMSIPRKLNN